MNSPKDRYVEINISNLFWNSNGKPTLYLFIIYVSYSVSNEKKYFIIKIIYISYKNDKLFECNFSGTG